jgi:hypothetical protein
MRGMKVVVFLAAALASVAALAGPGAERAFACSCVAPDPARDLPLADAAFVGRVLDRSVDEPLFSSADPAYWTFEVERAVKGVLPETLVVISAADGASCGLELALDQRIGLLLDKHGGRYASNLCWQADPDELLRHALPDARVVAGAGDATGRSSWPFALAGGLALSALGARFALARRARR